MVHVHKARAVVGAGVHSPYAVLDKLVPGYYHRRTEDGEVCNSTCCNNTATEHAMCGRLVVDDLVHWARSYKACPCASYPRVVARECLKDVFPLLVLCLKQLLWL